MPEQRKLTAIGSVHCRQYNCEAQFFTGSRSGHRHLFVRYGDGYSGRDLPVVEGRPEFAVAVPEDWTEADLHQVMLEPMNPNAPYPAWEVPSRAYGSFELFRWWSGEKPA